MGDVHQSGAKCGKKSETDSISSRQLREHIDWIVHHANSSCDGVFTLMSAVNDERLDEKSVRILIAAGANSQNAYYGPPLVYAIIRRQLEKFKVLLNAFPESAHYVDDSTRQTTLHLAVELGNLDMCRLLVEAGVNLSATDKYGKTPVRVAIDNHAVEIVRLFFEHGKFQISGSLPPWVVALLSEVQTKARSDSSKTGLTDNKETNEPISSNKEVTTTTTLPKKDDTEAAATTTEPKVTFAESCRKSLLQHWTMVIDDMIRKQFMENHRAIFAIDIPSGTESFLKLLCKHYNAEGFNTSFVNSSTTQVQFRFTINV